MLSKRLKSLSNLRFKYSGENIMLTIQMAVMLFGDKKVDQVLEGKHFSELQATLATLRK